MMQTAFLGNLRKLQAYGLHDDISGSSMNSFQMLEIPVGLEVLWVRSFAMGGREENPSIKNRLKILWKKRSIFFFYR